MSEFGIFKLALIRYASTESIKKRSNSMDSVSGADVRWSLAKEITNRFHQLSYYLPSIHIFFPHSLSIGWNVNMMDAMARWKINYYFDLIWIHLRHYSKSSCNRVESSRLDNWKCVAFNLNIQCMEYIEIWCDFDMFSFACAYPWFFLSLSVSRPLCCAQTYTHGHTSLDFNRTIFCCGSSKLLRLIWNSKHLLETCQSY